MKKIFILFLFALCFTKGAQAFNPDSAFAKGNALYQKKEFVKAAEAYQGIIKAGYQGASVYYNLGNAYFRDGKIGYAILNYEKAAKLSPGDDEIIHNLKVANFRTLDKVQPVPEFFLFRFWNRAILLFSVSGWTVASFIIYLAFLVFTGIYFVSGNPFLQRTSFFSGLSTLVLFMFAVTFLFQRISYQHSMNKGIIVVPTSVVKPAPDSQGQDSFVIHEGMKALIEDKVNEWVKIKLPDGKIGWIQGTNIEPI